MTRKRPFDKCRSVEDQSGVAAVEFVLTLPVLMLIMLAMAEFALMFAQYTTLTKSMEGGARYISNYSINGSFGTVSIDPAAELAAKNLIVYGNIAGSGPAIVEGMTVSDVSIQCTYGVQNDLCIVRDNIAAISLDADVSYQPTLGDALSGIMSLFGDGQSNFAIPMRASTVMSPIQ